MKKLMRRAPLVASEHSPYLKPSTVRVITTILWKIGSAEAADKHRAVAAFDCILPLARCPARGRRP
jgi:hypothetical protein